MSKKKTIQKEELISFYMSDVLEHGKRPSSVFKFCKNHNFEEALFYKHFGTLDALDQEIYVSFFDRTLRVLESSEDYKGFDTRSKLLSFYYTFFEILTTHRSYAALTLDSVKVLDHVKALSFLKRKFTHYISALEIDLPNLNMEKLERIQTKSLQESAWLQFLFIIRFWLNDHSPNMEKTDIFIEKTVHASFDIMDTTPLKSVFDLGKFLFKETFSVN